MKKAIEVIYGYSRPYVFGMIHVPALPGTPQNKLNISEIINVVKKETEVYAEGRVDGIILENMHDVPYCRKALGPEIISTMTMASQAVVSTLGSQRKHMLLGIQILAGGNQEALAVAHSTGLDLIRAECFVFSHVADEGWMDGCAGELLRYRKVIGAEKVAIITDVKKKHSSHSVTADISVGSMAEAAQFFLADGVILTGRCTGDPAKPKDINAVRDFCSLPVLIGSGVTVQNLGEFVRADGLIVGSEFKSEGKWENELDITRIQRFMDKVRILKRN